MGEGWCLGRPGLGRTTGGLGFRDREAFPSPWNTLPHLRSTLSSKAPFAQVAIYVSVSPKPGETQVASGPQSPYRTGKVLGRGAVGLAGRVPDGTQSCLGRRGRPLCQPSVHPGLRSCSSRAEIKTRGNACTRSLRQGQAPRRERRRQHGTERRRPGQEGAEQWAEPGREGLEEACSA